MARSIQTIYDEIVAQKETFSELDGLLPVGSSYASMLADLNSGSKVAIWRLWAYVVAVAHWVLETYWDRAKDEMQALADAAKYGSLEWYRDQALKFQLGDTLVSQNAFLTYLILDPVKQIVTHASANEGGRIVFMKVAKTVSGELVALDSSELTQFQAYINDVKPSGIKVTASSLNADEFRPVLTIKYDPILDPVDVRVGVEDAIRAWLDAVPFDARYTRLALEDAIQAVPGVVGIIITSLTSYSGLVPYVWTQEHTALAGYMIFDDQNSTITLTPA